MALFLHQATFQIQPFKHHSCPQIDKLQVKSRDKTFFFSFCHVYLHCGYTPAVILNKTKNVGFFGPSITLEILYYKCRYSNSKFYVKHKDLHSCQIWIETSLIKCVMNRRVNKCKRTISNKQPHELTLSDPSLCCCPPTRVRRKRASSSHAPSSSTSIQATSSLCLKKAY